MRRAEQLSVDVELALAPRIVADPHRRGLPPPRQVGKLAFGQVPLAADSEHDLQVVGLRERSGRRRGHVVEELVRLVGTGRHPQRLDGERGVPDPGVAVVPVARAADDLRAATWWPRHRSRRWVETTTPAAPVRCGGPGRGTDRRTPGAVPTTTATPTPCRPAAPRSRTRSTPGPFPSRPACCDAGRSRRVLPHSWRTGPRRTTRRRPVAPGTTGRGHRPHRSRRVPRRPRRATEAPGRTRVEGRTPPPSRPRRGCTSTCRSMRCGAPLPEVVPAVALPHRQRVDDDCGPGGRAVGRLQHHGAIHIATGDFDGAARPHRPVARLLTQQPAEHRRAVETRAAQPVDRPVPAHQRGTVPIGQQRVVGDRGVTHRRAELGGRDEVRKPRHRKPPGTCRCRQQHEQGDAIREHATAMRLPGSPDTYRDRHQHRRSRRASTSRTSVKP